MFGVLRRVFRHGRYVVVALVVTLGTFSAVLLVPQWATLWQVLISKTIDIEAKLSFLFSLYGTLGTSFSTFSRNVLFITVLLLGVNVALLIYYVRRQQNSYVDKTAHVASLGGLVSALLGIGCAACGSIILSAILSLLGASSLLLLLPFHGAEFAVFGIGLLIFSIAYLIKRINDPLVCPVN